MVNNLEHKQAMGRFEASPHKEVARWFRAKPELGNTPLFCPILALLGVLPVGTKGCVFHSNEMQTCGCIVLARSLAKSAQHGIWAGG